MLENKFADMIENKLGNMIENKLAHMLDNKFASFEDKIQRQIDSKIKTMENNLDLIEARLQVLEEQIQDTKQSTPQGDLNALENLKLQDMFKELEEKVATNLTLNSPEGQMDIKPIKEDMNNLLALEHEHNK